MDANGNVFVADSGGHAVKAILAAGGYTTINTLGSGFLNPAGITLDTNENVYVADFAKGDVEEILASGGYTTVNTLATGFSNLANVTLDAAGNLFIADTQDNRILRMTYAIPQQLTFASTPVGSTSSDSPRSVTVQNIGNATLTGSISSIAPNFAQVDGSGAPADCATSFSIAAGDACNLSFSFTSQSIGNFGGGSAVLFSDSLNGKQVENKIELSGAGILPATVVTGIDPSEGPLTGGTVVTITGTSFTNPASVLFGSSPATNVIVKSTTITATAPAAAAGAVDVTVTTPSGTSATSAADRFTYATPLSASQSIASAVLTQPKISARHFS